MSKQNRRSFIRKSVGTTSALVALGQARFAHSQAEPETSTSPNEQMNVAIIGTGSRGGSHIDAMLAADGVTISHICDADEERGSQRAVQIEKAQGSRPEFKTDLRRIMDVPSVDFVTIATPNHWHALAGIWAMQAG
ncbi:MAG: Gfo/Idh/MocA family oxidoreductase, partial [Aureliella sp.]